MDQLFEVYKLSEQSQHNPQFTQLFYEIRHKQYNSAWEQFKSQLFGDFMEQVFMTGVASVLSATAKAITYSVVFAATVAVITAATAGFGAAAAPAIAAPIAEVAAHAAALAVYTLTYTLLTKLYIDLDIHRATAYENSQTFYPVSSEKNAPTSLNQRSHSDRVFKDDMAAALIGHPGGYYSTVSGGEPGNMYTAEVLVTPPNLARVDPAKIAQGFGLYLGSGLVNALQIWDIQGANPDLYYGLDFDDMNLDWYLLTSELPSLYDMPEMGYQNVNPANNPHQYRHNTLGYLERKVNEATDAQFDSIRATCLDGVPAYEFINSGNYSKVMPLTPLYKPLVLSEERYDEVSIPDGHITVNVRAKDFDSTKGKDPYILDAWESQFYTARIDLHPNGFAYPITSLRIDIMKGDSTFAEGLRIDEENYEVHGESIYFTRTFESIISDSYEGWDEVLEQEYAEALIGQTIYYRLHLTFKQAVPDTTGETSRWALTQAVHYSIMDYFNQYEFAETTANMIGEIGYTECLTFYSTLLSVPFAALGSYAVHGLFGTQAVFGATTVRALLGQIAGGMATAPFKEIFEEVVYDAFIESLVENAVESAGGTEDMGFWLSSIATSVRESSGSLAKIALGGIKSKGAGIKSAFTLMKALRSGDPKVALDGLIEFNTELSQQEQQKIDKKASEKTWKKYLRSDLLKGIALIASSLLTGGASFFTVLGMTNFIEAAVEMRMEPTVQQLTAQHLMRKGMETDLKDLRQYLTGDYYLSTEGESGTMLGLRQPKALDEFGAALFGDCETIETLPSMRFRLTGAPPDKAVHTIKIDTDKDPYEIYKDVIKQMKLNPMFTYNFLVEGKVIDSISKLKNAGTERKMITVIAEQGAARPEVADIDYQKFEDLKKELEYAKENQNNPPENPTYWMKKYKLDTGKNAVYQKRLTKKYLKWIENKIQKINLRIKLSERQLKFKKTEQIKSNLDRYGQFADMITGDKYEILVSQKVQTLDGFLTNLGLARDSRFREQFGFFINGERITDFAGTSVNCGDQILIVPIIGSEGAFSPKFISEFLEGHILKRARKDGIEKISENDKKLIKLWWSVTYNKLYEKTEEWENNEDESPYRVILLFFREEIIDLLAYSGIIEDKTFSELHEVMCGKVFGSDNVRDQLGILIAKLNGNRNHGIKQFAFDEATFNAWLARIIYKILDDHDGISNKYYKINLIKDLFNRYSKLFGFSYFGNYKNPFEKETRVAVQTAVTVLYDFGIIKRDSIRSLQNAIKEELGLESYSIHSIYLQSTGGPSLVKINNFIQNILGINGFLETIRRSGIFDAKVIERAKEQIGRALFPLREKFSSPLYERLKDRPDYDFKEFLFSVVDILDPTWKIITSEKRLSALLFESEDYLGSTLRYEKRVNPYTFYKSCFKSFLWTPKDFNDEISNKEIKKRALKYRSLVKRFLFSEGSYIKKDTGGFETHIYEKYMDLRYNVQFHVWMSLALFTLDIEEFGMDISFKQIREILGTSVISNLLNRVTPTKAKNIEEVIQMIRELISVEVAIKDSGLISENLLLFKLSFYYETFLILEEYKDLMKKVEKVIDSEKFYNEYVLSSNYENICGIYNCLRDFLKNSESARDKMIQLGLNDKELTKMSSIGKGLTSETFHFDTEESKKIKKDFIEYLYRNKIFLTYSEEVSTSNVSPLTKNLMKFVLSLNDWHKKENLKKSIESYFKDHENLDVLTMDDSCLAAEIPMIAGFRMNKENEHFWAGISDLILKDGDTIYIADYKPNYDLGTESLSGHFINSFPQLIAYALTIAAQIDGDLRIKCIAFNDKEAVEFDPIEMFFPIKSFLTGKFTQTDTTTGAYKDYQGLMPNMKLVFQKFLEDFEIQLARVLELYEGDASKLSQFYQDRIMEIKKLFNVQEA